MKRKKILIVLGIILAIAIAAGLYIYKEYNRTHKDTAALSPDYSASATGLLQEFESDEQASNTKYWDKVIQVEGIVKEIIQDDKGFSAVVLGDTASMSSVRCSMDSIHSQETGLLIKGRQGVLKGICTGFNRDELLGSDVILVRCVIIPKKK